MVQEEVRVEEEEVQVVQEEVRVEEEEVQVDLDQSIHRDMGRKEGQRRSSEVKHPESEREGRVRVGGTKWVTARSCAY